ncbi:MAG: hypothetical protein KAS62_08865 [Candidatus Delongbacteria bacterium]|nr:hypothetical protein [Candidatus Delongbacteria bacterium]
MKKIIFVVIIIVFLASSCTQLKDEKTKAPTKKDSVKVLKNPAQNYMDVQVKHIDKAKASVKKNQKAQEDQKKDLDNLLGN